MLCLIGLAASIAAFQAGHLQLFQVVFTRARNNALPWTRADLYDRGSAGRSSELPWERPWESFAETP